MRTSDFDPVSIEVFTKQLRNATIFVLVVFALLVLRLWFLQIVNGWNYRTKSENNRIHLQDIPPFRGLIYDTKGIMLANNRPSYDLCIIPEEVKSRKELLDRLKHLIVIDPPEAMQRLAEGARNYPFRPVCVRKGISRDELAFIETHRYNLPGTMIEVAPQRHYIFGRLASHVLGYLGEISENQLRSGNYPDNRAGDFIGKSGVEWKWQRYLNGQRGGEQVEFDAAGRKIQVISRKPAVSGANVYLTINSGLQTLVEKAMAGKKGAIVALDPNSGQVLALASGPSFDPNVFIGGIDRPTWQTMMSDTNFPMQNRAVSGQYPPGSVFKIVVALAALEEGVIDPEEQIDCLGAMMLGRQAYHCWKKYGHGKVNLHRALVESCDIYFYKVGQRLGVDKIAHYAKRFGLGKVTGFDLGHEKEGLIPTSSWKIKRWGVPWQPGETLSMAIGQSFVLATPIQLATLISAVYHGGVLYAPQVTKQVQEPERGMIREFEAKITGNMGVKREHLELVKSGLIGAVNETRGTGSKARVDGILVAGKTGTAQVVTLEREKELGQDGEIPSEFRDHAWFVAVAPAGDPRLALAILIENGGHGGAAAAPIAKEIITAYLEEHGTGLSQWSRAGN